MMSYGAPVFNNIWDDVLDEVMGRIWIFRIASKFIEQEFGIENIDSHAGERFVGLPRHGWRIGWFFQERLDHIVFIDVDDPKTAGFAAWHLQTADGPIRSLFDILFQHQLIGPRVDVIT